MPDKEPVASAAPRRTPWPLLVAIALLAGGVAAAIWFGLLGRADERFDGKLTVLVRPPGRTNEPVPVESPGAVPVKTGGAMCLDAQLNQPAFLYFVWLDSAGNVLPLYPWNNVGLEVKDVGQPPPERRATKLIFSPLLGNDWAFGEAKGMEVVLLLARRTPLPTDINLAKLIAPLPQGFQPSGFQSTDAHRADKVTSLSLDSGAKSVSVLFPVASANQSQSPASDDPLAQLMLRLGQHFELVRAVRFAHE